MQLSEVIQALSVVSGIVTAVVAVAVARVRSKGLRELKQIDVSAEWQNQMLQRIAAVEAELRAERVRGDQLEREGFEWRRQANELEWELRAAKAQREEHARQLADLKAENEQLVRQNRALAIELRDLHQQIRGGHQTLDPSSITAKTRPRRE